MLIAAGFILLYRSWQVLFAAQREHRLAVSGPYARVRHPQYIGFLTIMAGFLLQWPTLLTLLMSPILVIVYLRLARKEERMMDAEFGEAYAAYRRQVPGFIPRLGRCRAGTGQKLQEGPCQPTRPANTSAPSRPITGSPRPALRTCSPPRPCCPRQSGIF